MSHLFHSMGGLLLLSSIVPLACSRNIDPFGGGSNAPSPAPSPSPPWTITGTVHVAPDTSYTPSPSDVLYVTARTPSPAPGIAPVHSPPIAVVAIPNPDFPAPFVLSPGHGGVMPTDPPGRLEISARLSRDGTAGPVRPGEPHGSPGSPVPPGASGVEVVLWVDPQ